MFVIINGRMSVIINGRLGMEHKKMGLNPRVKAGLSRQVGKCLLDS